MMILKLFGNKALSSGLLVLLVTMVWFGASEAEASWKSVRPDSTVERVRLVVVSEQEEDRTLRGIWTVLEPGQNITFALTGDGRIRLETRSVYRNPDDEDYYRLKVALADTVRKLKRRSVWEHNVHFQRGEGQSNPGEVRTIVGVGELDQLSLDWQASTGNLVVENQARNKRVILCRVLLGTGVSKVGRKKAEKRGKTLDQSLGIEALVPGVGWDSNALLTAKDDSTADPEAEWFLPVSIKAHFDKDINTRTSFQGKYSFSGAFYQNPVLDTRKHRLKLGGETRIGSQRARGGVDLFYGYRFTHKNDTYNGRNDREEFETIDRLTGLPIPLGNRFDYNEHRLEGGLRKKLGRQVETTFSMFGLVKDYIQDFSEYPDIYSLDQDHLEMELEITWRILNNTKLTGRFTYLAKDYDEKFSRATDGTEVTDTPTSLRNSNFVLVAEYGRGPGLRAHADLKVFQSKDQYAGYWDYAGLAVEGGLGWRWETGHKLSASVRRSHKDYDNARLSYDPAGDLRVKEVLNVRIGGDYILSGNWEVFFQYHFKNADNNNTSFAYLRTVIVAGLNFRH